MTRLKMIVAPLAVVALTAPALAESHSGVNMITDNDGNPGRSLSDFELSDSNEDGILNRDEYISGLYYYFDLDGDGSLNDEEKMGMNDAIEAGNPNAPE